MQSIDNNPAAAAPEFDPELWADYVRTVTRGASGLVISRRTGIHQTTISRWLSASCTQPNVRSVVAFARAYRVNPVQSMVRAAFLTASEAKLRRVDSVNLRDVSTVELCRELARRADVGWGAA